MTRYHYIINAQDEMPGRAFMVGGPTHLSVAYGDEMMELTIDEKQAKRLLKEVVIELVQERHDLFFDLMVEAIEETGMAHAIREGRQSSYVTEIEIRTLLEGEP